MQTDDELSNPYNPHLRLAIAVVEQALADIHRAGLLAIPEEGQAERLVAMRNAKQIADDARDFLLRRLWAPENPFGEVLRHHGVGRMTTARLIHGRWSGTQS